MNKQKEIEAIEAFAKALDSKYCGQDKCKECKYSSFCTEIFQILYELCKVRKQIEWDDIWFLVKRYGVEVDDE